MEHNHLINLILHKKNEADWVSTENDCWLFRMTPRFHPFQTDGVSFSKMAGAVHLEIYDLSLADLNLVII